MGGLLLLLVGTLALVADVTDLSVDLRWAAPAVLIAVGVAGLVGTVRSRQPGERP